MSPDTEEDRIYNWVADFCDIERVKHGTPAPLNLSDCYQLFKVKYFGSSVPELSAAFVCVFQKLPYDIAGITLLGEDAAKRSATEGIRINEKLREFPAEAKVALLHEMIHATGVRGHDGPLVAAIEKLWNQQAYLDPLIL
jgi:hypothetical protein